MTSPLLFLYLLVLTTSNLLLLLFKRSLLFIFLGPLRSGFFLCTCGPLCESRGNRLLGALEGAGKVRRVGIVLGFDRGRFGVNNLTSGRLPGDGVRIDYGRSSWYRTRTEAEDGAEPWLVKHPRLQGVKASGN